MSKRNLIIGDVHGRWTRLMSALEACNYDPSNDRLISVGDWIDGSSRVKECIEWFTTQPDAINVIGNHDKWFLDWVQSGDMPHPLWLYNGGATTLRSYGYYDGNANRSDARTRCREIRYVKDDRIPESHVNLFRQSHSYYEDNECEIPFVVIHGGFRPEIGYQKETLENLTWDRELLSSKWWQLSHEHPLVIVGHTISYLITRNNLPVFRHSPKGKLALVGIDTAGASDFPLTIYCPEENNYWQSTKTADDEIY